MAYHRKESPLGGDSSQWSINTSWIASLKAEKPPRKGMHYFYQAKAYKMLNYNN